MAKRKNNHANSPVVPIVIILLLLVAITLAAWFFWKQQQASPTPPATTSPTASAPATEPDLITDNHILFGGMPRSTRPDVTFTVLKNAAYIVGYSETRKDPLWSAYHVIRMPHPFVLPRPKGDFLTDTRTASQVTHHDYTGSGYDRGHMTPNSAIARCFGEQAQHETFLLSNICPQAPALNQKVWEKLEMAEIDYANTYDEVWITDGPIFGDMNGGATRKLRSGISVPTAFYKILVEDQGGRLSAFAVIMPQTVKGTELPSQYLASIQEIQQKTGLEFLWKLDPATRESLINKVWPMWEQ